MATITLDNGDRSITLYAAQENQSENSGEVNATTPTTKSASQTTITSLKVRRRFTLTGLTTWNQVTDKSEFSNDPLVALAEWTQKFMTFLTGQQGTGLTLFDDERDQTLNVVLESAGWQRNEGAIYEVQWNVSAIVGEGLMETRNASRNIADPWDPSTDSTPAHTLDGTDLQYLQSIREDKRIDVNLQPQANANTAEDNLVEPLSGAQRTIRIVGKHTGDRSARNTFADTIRGLAGDNQVVPYDSAFPGHTLDVAITSFDETRQAGWPENGEYELELIQGRSLGNPTGGN